MSKWKADAEDVPACCCCICCHCFCFELLPFSRLMLGVLPGMRPVNDLVSGTPSLEEDENAMLMLDNGQNS